MLSIDRSDFFNSVFPKTATWMSWSSVRIFSYCVTLGLIFAMAELSTQHIRFYQYALTSESKEESHVADVYPSLPLWVTDSSTAILASARILASILSTVNSLRNTRTFLSNPLSYDLSTSFSDYVVIDYVTVPVQTRAAGREDSEKTLHKDEPEIGVFKHKEHRTRDDGWFWAEWP